MGVYASLLRATVLPMLLNREKQKSALKHLRFLEQSQYWPRQRLLDYQWQRLTALLKHAYETTSYYRKTFDEHGLTPDSFKNFDDLRKLPILTRDLTYDRAEEFFSNRYARNEIQQFLSGGTVGQQAVLYRDQESFNIKLGLTWRHEGWMGRRPCDKMALVWPVAMDFNFQSRLRTKIKDRYLLRQVMFHAGLYTDKSLQIVYRDFMQLNAPFVKAFPSTFYAFTRFCIEKGLPVPKLKGIMCTGEPLHEYQRALFEETYHSPVFDMYGSREVGNTACECSQHSGRHLALETSIVEFIRDGKPVEVGEEGEIFVTDLTNYAFPLIRYQINDYGILTDGNCTCGRGLPLLDRAVGRVSDDVYSENGTRMSGIALGTELEHGGPFIGQMQFVQHSLRDFEVRITNKPEPTQEMFDFIERKLKSNLGESINVTISVVEQLHKEKSGKVRLVINEYDEVKKSNRTGEATP